VRRVHAMRAGALAVASPASTRAARVARLNVARAAALQQARHGGTATHVQTVPGGPAPCLACQQLAGRVFTLSEAIAKPPLPCAACTTKPHAGCAPVCRCTYRLFAGDPRE
jgi:hypothetical protein